MFHEAKIYTCHKSLKKNLQRSVHESVLGLNSIRGQRQLKLVLTANYPILTLHAKAKKGNAVTRKAKKCILIRI